MPTQLKELARGLNRFRFDFGQSAWEGLLASISPTARTVVTQLTLPADSANDVMNAIACREIVAGKGRPDTARAQRKFVKIIKEIAGAYRRESQILELITHLSKRIDGGEIWRPVFPGKPGFATEDVVQRGLFTTLKAFRRHPDLVDELAADDRHAARFIAKAMEWAGKDYLREENACHSKLQGEECAEWAGAPFDPESMGHDDAVLIVERVRDGLGPKGELALDICLGDTTFAEYIAWKGICSRTAERHFAQGVAELRKAVCHRLVDEFGEAATRSFIEAVLAARKSGNPKPIPKGVWRSLKNVQNN